MPLSEKFGFGYYNGLFALGERRDIFVVSENFNEKEEPAEMDKIRTFVRLQFWQLKFFVS